MKKSIITLLTVSVLGMSNMVAASDSFSVLEGIDATPMNAEEMDAVQGRATPIQIPRVASGLYGYTPYPTYSFYSWGGWGGWGGPSYYYRPIGYYGATPIQLP